MNYIDQDELAAMQKAEMEMRLGKPKKKPIDVYDMAIERYGIFAQTVKAIEEMSELTKELAKVFCGEVNNDHIAEEIGDVEIMLEQMKRIYAEERDVQIWKAQKLVRLWERIKGNET